MISDIAIGEKLPPLKVSIPAISAGTTDRNQVVLKNIANELASQLNRQIEILIVPFGHSFEYIKSGRVDFHLPLIKVNKKNNTPFVYSDATLYHVNFVLYLNDRVNLSELDLGNLTIETERSHQEYFSFPTTASTCILCSLKRVQLGLIDGYLFADSSTDPVLVKYRTELPNISRKLYQTFEVKVIFPKTKQGYKLNKKISAAIESLKNSGRLAELLIDVDLLFNEKL